MMKSLIFVLIFMSWACGGGAGGVDTTVSLEDSASPDTTGLDSLPEDLGACVPACSGLECGDDGCGGSCGKCPSAAPFCVDKLCRVTCTPTCDGQECGDDGCGGSCGECGLHERCVDRSCQCSADCGERECGDNGCGGSCGECWTEAPFCVQGLCVSECTPDCDGRECGDNGCGGTCGQCPEAAPLCINNLCAVEECTPDCDGRECGADGCGGSCGQCPETSQCLEGSCVEMGVDRCKVCETDQDCQGSLCQPLTGAKFCFQACETTDGCPTGWMCQQSSPLVKVCVPMSFTCSVPCLKDGCDQGQACIQLDEPGCRAAADRCESCSYDWECGEGLRCYKEEGFCAPSCPDDSCPENSQCQTVNAVPMKLCLPTGPACCFGPTCNSTECSGDKPHVFQDQCVECLTGEHCNAGYLCQDHVCVPQEVEVCDSCQVPYPACASVLGTWVCVECSDDSFCGDKVCDLQTYSCIFPDGCGSDADCPAGTGFTLQCHTQSSSCYDVKGRCDDEVAFCSGASSQCTDISMYGNGILPPAACSCPDPMTLEDLLICQMMGTCPGSVSCPAGTSCADLSLLGGIPLPGLGLCLAPEYLGGIMPFPISPNR